MIIPVILSGGAGTRLWPLSRQMYPKQLLPLVTDKTLLQETVLRTEGLADIASPIVVCNEDHRFMVAEQLTAIGQSSSAIVLEPVGRNTAPSIALAALKAIESDHDSTLLVLPADHVITNVNAFHDAVNIGVKVAQEGKLVTFGIVPDCAETGYGYIKAGPKMVGDAASFFEVARFVEKPDLQTAQAYLEEGGYMWNSGMFIFKASHYLEELERHCPQIVTACGTALEQAQTDLDFVRLEKHPFDSCPSVSIDYAVMEKTKDAVVVSLNAGWSDIGSWSALAEVSNKTSDGNVIHGDVLLDGCKNNFVYAGHRLVAAVGLKDCIVVETADALLVTTRDKSQDVKKIVEKLKNQERCEALLHRRVNRPWGSYEGIERSERYQVKRIEVSPGAKLSLQKHHHRAEHWIVVSGTAQVTCDDEVLILTENQSTYIPLGAAHRLENPGKIPLELIEIQSGSYLGEDDIVRFEDSYGR